MSVVAAEQVHRGTLTVLSAEEMPQHIAIIMDGNGRWAQRRHMPRTLGHRAGVEALHRIVKECGRLGIPMLTVYAFSTENWSRPLSEVNFLMRLLAESFNKYLDRLIAEGVHIRHLGRKDRLPGDLLKRIAAAEEATAENTRLQLNVALDYGARAELTEAIRAMACDGLDLCHVTEEQISSYLYTRGLPDPDLIIRTGGEVRLSNFLLWQAAYAEYYSTEKCWPDFEAQDLRQALLVFLQRQRRFGGVIGDA
ncbi:MAG: isoprenyl transferase [Chloroflexi bacterium]|nr:isoprenyl transferase [Chloroflexota bacterium]